MKYNLTYVDNSADIIDEDMFLKLKESGEFETTEGVLVKSVCPIPSPSDTLNIVGRIIIPNNELPLGLRNIRVRDTDYDFEFIVPEFKDNEDLGNIITGEIDNLLGGSYSYEYDVYFNGHLIVIEAE